MIEFERPQLTPVERYYFDLKFANHSYGSMIFYIDELIDTLPCQHTLTSSDAAVGGLYPSEELFEQDKALAVTMLAVLPLELCGPVIERAESDPKRIKEWYGSVVSGIMSTVGSGHEKHMLHGGDREMCSCSKSVLCPAKFAAQHLANDMEQKNFGSSSDITSLNRSYTVVRDKLHLAMGRELLARSHGERLEAVYEQEFNRLYR